MTIQLQKDKRTHSLKCVVNKATYVAAETVATSSSSPTPPVKLSHPTTPAQKGNMETSVKRHLQIQSHHRKDQLKVEWQTKT
ncbi:hypothetical protein HanPI659440_Chr01g0004001 [Helianthus annuus]|nr:hypothetical protein HanPI659440_Chr01g0004001 [Helianthus annuus]